MMRTKRPLARYLTLLLILGLTGCSSEGLDPVKTEMQLNWQKMEREVATWVDALGQPIDAGVKDAVVALNLLGFTTSASCEGHIDWGLPYPWVDFASHNQEVDALREALINIEGNIQKKEAYIQKQYPSLSIGDALKKENSEELNALYAEKHALYDKMEKAIKAKFVALKELLDTFYQNYKEPDRMIILFGEFAILRLKSVGGDWQVARDIKQKSAKLREYQEEMKAFANFLKQEYFKNRGKSSRV